MPDQITAGGLEVKSLDEILSALIAAFQTIYGTDINIDQSSPDGQALNIYAQGGVDLRELLVQVYNSFAIDSAFGQILDQRLALNGIARSPGTYTFVDVEVTVDRALTLPGLDGDVNETDGEGYTIADDEGNQFILAATHVFVGAGTATLSFRARAIGEVLTIPNTITNPVTITLGVTGVNNPAASTQIGENEETDLELRIRHAKSFLLAATGPADAVLAALLALDGVTDAYVAENITAAPVDDVPAHSLWIIVEGGDDDEIGDVIYTKKAPGCGLKGDVTVNVPRPNGLFFPAQFDRPEDEDLWIEFTIVPKPGSGAIFDTDLLKTQLVAQLRYKIAQSATIGDVLVAMLSIAPQGVLSDVGVSNDGMAFVDILEPSDFQKKFVLDVARIDITV